VHRRGAVKGRRQPGRREPLTASTDALKGKEREVASQLRPSSEAVRVPRNALFQADDYSVVAIAAPEGVGGISKRNTASTMTACWCCYSTHTSRVWSDKGVYGRNSMGLTTRGTRDRPAGQQSAGVRLRGPLEVGRFQRNTYLHVGV